MTQNCIGLHTKTAANERLSEDFTKAAPLAPQPREIYSPPMVIIFQRKNLNDALLRRHKLLT